MKMSVKLSLPNLSEWHCEIDLAACGNSKKLLGLKLLVEFNEKLKVLVELTNLQFTCLK